MTSDGGLTLVELAFYLTIFSLLLVPLVSLGIASTRAVVEHDTVTRLQERNRVCLFRVARDFRESISSTATVTAGGRTLTFLLPAGFDGSGATPGDRISYRLRPRGESSSGELVRRNETRGEEVVVCGTIDLATSGFELNGAALTITISNVGILGDGESPLTVSRKVTAFQRN